MAAAYLAETSFGNVPKDPMEHYRPSQEPKQHKRIDSLKSTGR